MLNFDFLKKGPGIVSTPHFVYDFSRKMFLMLYSVDTFFLSEQKFSFFIASTDLRVISKLLQ